MSVFPSVRPPSASLLIHSKGQETATPTRFQNVLIFFHFYIILINFYRFSKLSATTSVTPTNHRKTRENAIV